MKTAGSTDAAASTDASASADAATSTSAAASASTKERILDEALTLFSQKGYLATSMSDIAGAVGITKGALYKHYESKLAILQAIFGQMSAVEDERAQAAGVPIASAVDFAEGYAAASPQAIRDFALEQFRYWTEDRTGVRFRKMLVLEQYRDDGMARLHRDYLAEGPLTFMAQIFGTIAGEGESDMQLALDFYGPIYLLMAAYDSAEDKEQVKSLLGEHVDAFISRMEKLRPS